VNARHKPYLLFLLLLALFPALAVAVRAVQEGTASLAAWEWLLLAAFPLLLWLFLRYFSRLGCSGNCSHPDPH
jgi:uncharacterized membrane protein YhaH (DUF805 family)